jgi:hypothetical protein
MSQHAQPQHPHLSLLARGLLAGAALLLASGGAAAQSHASLPFRPGESCTYQGSGPLGRMGSGTFAVENDPAGPAGTWLLRFDFRGRVAFVGVENHTRSWFNPSETSSFRFTKVERGPMAAPSESVDMNLAARRWSGTRGTSGAMVTGAPLDELSFIFFLRTLGTGDGASYSLTRHYDSSRNPTRVRVVGRGPLTVPAGVFNTVELEMRVRDPNRYGGEGVIRIHLTDDARRLPVRIDSRIPRAGHMVLALEAITPTCGALAGSARSTD